MRVNETYLMGVFDPSFSSSPVGDLLILLEELKIWSERLSSPQKFEISFIGNEESFLSPMLLGMEGVENCHLFPSWKELQKYRDRASENYFLWPDPKKSALSTRSYGSTLFIQEYYQENGRIPYLSCSAQLLEWASQFIQKYVSPSLPIVVHLKNRARKSGQPDWYNARFEEWLLFFKDVEGRYDIKFLLIGNEVVPDEIRKCSNVIVTQDYSSCLSRDLALMQSSFAFMGVASGPCAMAMFRDIPYVIFKNPEHHVEKMDEELEDSDHFAFATSAQRFLRRLESREVLGEEFQRLLRHSSAGRGQIGKR